MTSFMEFMKVPDNQNFGPVHPLGHSPCYSHEPDHLFVSPAAAVERGGLATCSDVGSEETARMGSLFSMLRIEEIQKCFFFIWTTSSIGSF